MKKYKFAYIKYKLITLFCCLLFVPGYVPFESTGENFFHIFINGTEVGVTNDVQAAEKLFIQARKDIASANKRLVFMDAEMSVTGEEVLYGYVDEEDVILKNMSDILDKSVLATMRPAYTVKVNEYMVNLADYSDVLALLQAALIKYDASDSFEVKVSHDNSRELNVYQALVEKKTTQIADESWRQGAGAWKEFNTVTELEVDEQELDFDSFKYGVTDMSFAQQVEIVETYLPSDKISDLATAVEELTKDQETPSIYKVVSGDTLSEIAIKVNIPMEQIAEMNSELLPDVNAPLHIGDELVITVPEPELMVNWTERKYYEEIYDEDIQYIDVDDWYTNQTQVVQQPSAGFRRVVADVTYLDEKEVDKILVREEVAMEAVPKIIKRGTKVPPTYIKPISGGRKTSGFGKRKAPKKGASTYHKGVDWATPVGTSVYASCGGTVEKAGWGSGYGNVVYINHEDGRQTRYGHLSKVLVKPGQQVKQGDKIALSGNTGVSTGPHIHFEILIDGTQVDPEKYLQ